MYLLHGTRHEFLILYYIVYAIRLLQDCLSTIFDLELLIYHVHVFLAVLITYVSCCPDYLCFLLS